MIIGVIGAGSLGSSVGRALSEGGHEVIFSSRHPARLRPLAGIRVATVEEAAEQADVLLLSTPYRALPSVARTLNPYITGKVIIDATNPNPSDYDDLSETSRRDGMGVTTQRYLPEARVVRAFSSINAWNVVSSRNDAQPLGVPVAGDDKEAVALVEKLVRDAGCAPVTTGDLESGRIFEWGNPGCLVNTNEAGLRRAMGK
ncbi:NADPH-dependent F420 reductase [Corynebacterium sp. S7]